MLLSALPVPLFGYFDGFKTDSSIIPQFFKQGLKKEIECRNDPDVCTPNNLPKLDQFLAEVIFVFNRASTYIPPW